MKKLIPFLITTIICFTISVATILFLGKHYFNNWYFEIISTDTQDTSARIIIQSPGKVEVTQDIRIKEIVKQVKPSTVILYKKRNSGSDTLSQIYQEKDFVGHGTILTSDGWIVATEKNLLNMAAKNIVVLYKKKIYDIKDKQVDRNTNSVLLKFDEQNLPVVKFGSIDNIEIGEQLIGLNQNNIYTLRMSKNNYADGSIIQSSEFYYNYPQLSGLETQVGSPVINFQGYMMGVIIENNPSTKTLLPINYLQKNIKNSIKTSREKQPYLGVNFLDLAFANGLNVQTTKNLDSGALLYGRLSKRAINSDSPLFGKLKEGDIITAIDGKKIDQKNSLTNLILSKKTGQEIEIEYLQTPGKQLKIRIKI